MKFVLPEPPSANRYWRNVGTRVLLSREARQYRHDAEAAMIAQGFRPTLHPPFGKGVEVAVTLEWHRSIKSGDLDNRIKQSLDVLKGVLYADDAQVVELHAYRHEAPKAGKLVVVVERASKGRRREAA